jgi:hypothetical protein
VTLRRVLNSWGPGKFDASVFLDGKAVRPDGRSAAVMIPPAFGLAGVNLHTSTGWGGVSHWNAFVANLLMLFTEPGWNMHTAEEIGIDDFQAQRAPDGRYRTTPLRGLFTRLKGGFYHDGRFKSYEAVVDHYNGTFGLALSGSDRAALIEYLKSL